VLQQRIDDVTKSSFEKRSVYKLKSTQVLNRNIGLYNEAQLEYVKTELRDFLYYFGYVHNEHDTNNNTPFFTFDDASHQARLQGYKGF